MKYLNLFITRDVAVLMEQIEPTPLLKIPQSSSLKSLRIWLHGGLKLMLMRLSACFCHSVTRLKEKTTFLHKLTPFSLMFSPMLSGAIICTACMMKWNNGSSWPVPFFCCPYTHWSHILSMLFHQLRYCWLDQTHNPNLSETWMYWGCSRVPGEADRRANGGFHACVSAGRKQFARHEWAQKAAYLLGCTLEELSSSIFKHQAKGTLPRAGSVRQAVEEIGTADAGTPQTTFTHSLYPLGLSPLSCWCQSHVLFPHVQEHTSALITWGCEGTKAYLNTTALQWLLTKHAHIVLGQTVLDPLFIYTLGIIIASQ